MNHTPPDPSTGLPYGFAEAYGELDRLLAEAATIHPEPREQALAAAAEAACRFLSDLMDGGPFLEALRTVSTMDSDRSAQLVADLRDRRMNDFLQLELRLLLEAGVPSLIAERLVVDCETAVARADPSMITGGPAIAAFLRLRHECCDLEERERRRVREYADDRERAANRRWARWALKSVGGVVTGAVDFSVLPTAVFGPTFLKEASALAGSAVVNLADVLVPDGP
jgi:hypothetical protein